MKTLTWQKPGQQNVAQELIKIIINYVAELRFNCNSGDSKVDELELEQIGSTFSFVFENKYPDCPKEHNLYCRKFAYKKNWQENDNEMILYINS